MAERRKFFKAVTTGLTGPHYGGLLYLPGTTHRLGIDEPFDSDANGWCTAGLYVASHQRVAARWGQVVIEVLKDVGAPLVKTNRRHKPTGVPSGVDSGSYCKYRTTGFTVLRIVGVVGYGLNESQSRAKAHSVLVDMNQTLRRHGKRVAWMTDRSLERLRDDGYRLWEVHDPNAISAGLVVMPPRYHYEATISFDTERPIDQGDLYTHMGKLAGVYPGSQRIVSLR